MCRPCASEGIAPAGFAAHGVSAQLKARFSPCLPQAQDALWPAVKASLRLALNDPTAAPTTAGAGRRRVLLAAAPAVGAGATLPFAGLPNAAGLLSQYFSTLLRQQALSSEQSLAASLKARCWVGF